MEQKEKELDNIELRSEKVRNVIGKVPPRLVSLGTVIITIIVLALAVAFYKIPYPISIETNGEVVNISYQFDVASHSTKLVHKEDGNYFVATTTINTQGNSIKSVLQKYMKADVRIIISNKTLWQQVFG